MQMDSTTGAVILCCRDAESFETYKEKHIHFPKST